MRTDLRHL